MGHETEFRKRKKRNLPKILQENKATGSSAD